jgi:hypothetical protein
MAEPERIPEEYQYERPPLRNIRGVNVGLELLGYERVTRTPVTDMWRHPSAPHYTLTVVHTGLGRYQTRLTIRRIGDQHPIWSEESRLGSEFRHILREADSLLTTDGALDVFIALHQMTSN